MTFKPRTWFPIAVVLSAVNVAAVWFAAVPAEPLHATGHAVLALTFGVWAQRLRTASARAELEAGQDRLEAFDAFEGEMDALRRELAETQERLDFAERVLVQQPERRQVKPEQ